MTGAEPLPADWYSKGAKGAASELVACAYLMRLGFHVYRCESPAAPFDLVVYRDGVLRRVEVKSINWARGSQYGPGLSWPANDEWDLLLAVGDDGRCIEVTTHDKAAGTDQVRAAYGFEPARRPALLAVAQPTDSTQTSAQVLELLQRHPDVDWTAREVARLLQEEGTWPTGDACRTRASTALLRLYDRGLVDRQRQGVYRTVRA